MHIEVSSFKYDQSLTFIPDSFSSADFIFFIPILCHKEANAAVLYAVYCRGDRYWCVAVIGLNFLRIHSLTSLLLHRLFGWPSRQWRHSVWSFPDARQKVWVLYGMSRTDELPCEWPLSGPRWVSAVIKALRLRFLGVVWVPLWANCLCFTCSVFDYFQEWFCSVELKKFADGWEWKCILLDDWRPGVFKTWVT